MSHLRVDPRSPTPPSRQLVEAVLDAVGTGFFAAEGKLPSVRALAAEALVNPNTVGKAYRELEAMGVVEGRSGAGVFVTAQGPRIARRERQATTERAVKAAVAAAQRAGHGEATIAAWIEHCLADVSNKGTL